MEHKEPSRLEQIQKWFWKFVISPDSVEDAKNTMEQECPDSVPLQRWIHAETEDKAIQRLTVYANMYFYRIVDFLHDLYEATAAVLGDHTFMLMCADYCQYYPPKAYSLDDIGKELPEFLEKYAPPEQLPWLHELATLEAVRYDLITAPDEEPLSPESLQQIPPEQWGAIRFQPIGALRLLSFQYPIHLAWRAAADEEEIPSLEAEPSSIVVWREGFSVTHLVVSPAEKRAYEMLMAGESFEEICFSFLEEATEEPSEEELHASIQQAYQTLSQWVRSGMLRALQ